MKFSKINTFLVIIISVISGLLAGFLGCLLFLISPTINIPFVSNLEKYFPKKEITIKTQEKITVSRDVLVEKLTKDLNGQIVRVAVADKLSANSVVKNKKVLNSNDVLDQAYLEKEILGSGFILTNDGWIISAESAVSDTQKKYAVLTDDNKIYPVEKIIKDSFTGIIFLKISASDLPVVKLGSKDDIILGQEALIFDKNKKLITAYLSRLKFCSSKEKKDLIRNTEKFCEFILIDQSLNENFYGSALINLDKSFIGVVGKDNQIIPSYYLKNLVNQVLRSKETERVFWGIDFIDLSSIALAEEDLIKTIGNKGVIVYQLTKNSPAIKAGLKKDDIILKVDEIIVNHQNTFQELLQEYKKGDVLELTILREGKEKIIELRL